MTMINNYSTPPIELTRHHLQEIGQAWLVYGKAVVTDAEAKLRPTLKRMLAPITKATAAPAPTESA
jgi:hypothetical protein